MDSQIQHDSPWVIFIREVPDECLKKGGFIPAELVERATGLGRGDLGFRFGQLELKSRLEHQLSATVKCEGFGLRILTDAEASEYNGNRFKNLVRGSFRAHSRLQRVDVSNLDTRQRSSHEHRLLCQSRILQAVNATNKEVKLIPYRKDK